MCVLSSCAGCWDSCRALLSARHNHRLTAERHTYKHAHNGLIICVLTNVFNVMSRCVVTPGLCGREGCVLFYSLRGGSGVPFAGKQKFQPLSVPTC